MKLGIDLHNIRDGGGINYISNLLKAFDPARHGIDRIVLFGSTAVLAQMPDAPGIEKRAVAQLSRGILHRLWFVIFRLTGMLRAEGCDLLYSPGGLYFGSFRPFVTISRNMMPFDLERHALYPYGFDRVRLWLLRRLHALTFRRADAMIFLTEIARSSITAQTGTLRGLVRVIPHGVDRRRFRRRRGHPLARTLSREARIRVIYPSRLEPYKHQFEVVTAVGRIRARLPEIQLRMAGPANPVYLPKVTAAIDSTDPSRKFIAYDGEVPNTTLPRLYEESDILLFASSCENMPNLLLEGLAFGIPIVSSRVAPMPEIAGEAARWFDPFDAGSIADALLECVDDWAGTRRRVAIGLRASKQRGWGDCADRTFAFMREAVGTGRQN